MYIGYSTIFLYLFISLYFFSLFHYHIRYVDIVKVFVIRRLHRTQGTAIYNKNKIYSHRTLCSVVSW